MALRDLGHHVYVDYVADRVAQNRISILQERSGVQRVRLAVGDVTHELDVFDVFWNRRPSMPRIRGIEINASDKKVAEDDYRSTFNHVYRRLSRQCFAVNGFDEARIAEDKLIQLDAARAAGFDIPDTLVSDNRSHIVEFIKEANDKCLTKPLNGVVWKCAGGGFATSFASKVTLAQLVEFDGILTPQIYQKYIDKKYEIRVTCMGDHVVAVRIDSQADQNTMVDWRRADFRKLKAEEICLPLWVKEACIRTLRHLGVLFGCIDLIYTKTAEYVFLEVNQMGQWLWLEKLLPECDLLRKFCSFLLSKDPSYDGTITVPAVSFAAYEKSAYRQIRADADQLQLWEDPDYVVMD